MLRRLVTLLRPRAGTTVLGEACGSASPMTPAVAFPVFVGQRYLTCGNAQAMTPAVAAQVRLE